MKNTVIGIKFEKFVQQALSYAGILTERNVMFHKEKRRCQVDLLRRGGWIRRKTIYECKYLSPGSSPDFSRQYVQLAEAMIFTSSDGVLATNIRMPRKYEKEKEYGIKIIDLDYFGLRPRDLEKTIRKMSYNPNKDYIFIHKDL